VHAEALLAEILPDKARVPVHSGFANFGEALCVGGGAGAGYEQVSLPAANPFAELQQFLIWRRFVHMFSKDEKPLQMERFSDSPVSIIQQLSAKKPLQAERFAVATQRISPAATTTIPRGFRRAAAQFL
jgi:hypothetical protein